MLPIYNRTGWFTFFLVITGFVPLITNLLNLIQGLINMSSQTDTFSGILGGLVANSIGLGLSVLYTKWLWEVRSALILSQTTKHPGEALTLAQASFLKYLKVSTIIQIISLSVAAVGLTLLLIFAAFLTHIR